ncbi:Z-ring formation inhibitor MciZ [Paenibacillus psychroresistens]|uniref:Z-ring formation inhibitor MciZ n=1 Tax=Paenibacillus psychroresistens TaxID=1778678 RepID=A0A6B8RIT7_9BACL|nr:Z-ring formation inhibitor MciZ [Paenibacillus psychroresistens]QGQ95969.1 Z-ring formation inhibitor MciZ [Paenibacillus psychroresistens]
MKSYFAPQQLCLVGKAWEVQHYLRKLSARPASLKQPLVSVLQDRVNPAQLKRPYPFTLVSSKEG